MPKKIYCGAQEPKKNQKIGKPEDCVNSGQIRMYGLEKINKNLLKKIKPKEIKKKESPKKKSPKVQPKKKSPKVQPKKPKKMSELDKQINQIKDVHKIMMNIVQILNDNPDVEKKFENKYIQLQKEFDKINIKLLKGETFDREEIRGDQTSRTKVQRLESKASELLRDIQEGLYGVHDDLDDAQNNSNKIFSIMDKNPKIKQEFSTEYRKLNTKLFKLFNELRQGAHINQIEVKKIKDDMKYLLTEINYSMIKNKKKEGEGLNMKRKLFGRKDERADPNKFVTFNSGGKFIDEDMRRQMNAVQVQSLYGSGCMNCGGNFNQAFSDAISSEGGNFFFEKDFDKVTAIKPESSILSSIKNIIKIITGNSKSIIPFGSWTYRSQQFPSDVDLISIEEKCCSKEEATKKFVKRIQNIVKKINDTKGVYLGDIKAGIDHVFKVDIGQIIYDNLGNATIINYDPEIIRGFIMEWSKLKLITTKEKNEILKLVTKKISQESFEKLYEMLREKWLLRWSSDEILKGVKILPGNRKYTLGEAINDPTMTKIDVWTQISGRYIEFSNVLTLYMVDEKGNYKLLNFDNADVDIVEALKYEIQKYAFSIKDLKLFKMVKRMWSIARMTGDEEMVFKLTELMQSDFGRLSQIISELETVMLMLEGIKNPPIKSIKKQIESWKYKLSNVYELDVDVESINKILDLVLARKMNTKKDKEYVVKVLKQLKTDLSKISNDNLYVVLQNIGLIPIPTNYLPNSKKGSGLYQTAANIYRRNFCNGKARPLLDGELHPKCWNFCGPGTRIDLDEVKNYPPYNQIDNVCRTHDLDYYHAKDSPDKQQLIRAADIKMLKDIEPYKKESGYNIAKAAISSKIKAEDLFPNAASRLFPEHAGRK